MPLILVERAPAKINLSLHIIARRADGLHDLESLVVFSRAGDCLFLKPGVPLALSLEGPTASAVGELDDNLVLTAARHFATRFPLAKLGAFHLIKHLPVAAGLGGGSSDAAAALRLLARTNQVPIEDSNLHEAARMTGADVPVCLLRKPRIMRGVGDMLGPFLLLPPLFGLLVNPGVPVETKAVFAQLKLAPGEISRFNGHPEVGESPSAESLIEILHKGRNDLELAACRLVPLIGDVLAVLTAAPGCRLARMSGSGATCFAIFKDRHSLVRARKVILQAHPAWWVKSGILS